MPVLFARTGDFDRARLIDVNRLAVHLASHVNVAAHFGRDFGLGRGGSGDGMGFVSAAAVGRLERPTHKELKPSKE